MIKLETRNPFDVAATKPESLVHSQQHHRGYSVLEKLTSIQYPRPEDLEISKQVRERLMQILLTSTILDARVWLDGVHTSLNKIGSVVDNGHELYIKIEGKIDSRSR